MQQYDCCVPKYMYWIHVYVHMHSQKCPKRECGIIQICTYSLAVMPLAMELLPSNQFSIELILTIFVGKNKAPHRKCTTLTYTNRSVQFGTCSLFEKHKVCYLDTFCFLLLWIEKLQVTTFGLSIFPHFTRFECTVLDSSSLSVLKWMHYTVFCAIMFFAEIFKQIFFFFLQSGHWNCFNLPWSFFFALYFHFS